MKQRSAKESKEELEAIGAEYMRKHPLHKWDYSFLHKLIEGYHKLKYRKIAGRKRKRRK